MFRFEPKRGPERALLFVDVSCTSRTHGPCTKNHAKQPLISNGRRSGAPEEVDTLPREAGFFGADCSPWPKESQCHVEKNERRS